MREIYFKPGSINNAHYCPAIINSTEQFIFVSGQLPINIETREICRGDITQQTKLVLSNIEKLLKLSGSDKQRIIRTTAYITRMEDWEAVNEVYAEFFAEQKPARTILCVKEIHFGAAIEIEAIAEKC